MKDTVLVLGPYCGDWETEITLFRPYMRWISKVLCYDKIFISTHLNRAFLYDWIDRKNIIPVYGNLSREELYQKGVINNNLTQKDYFIIQKQLLYQILGICGKNKAVFHNFFLNYTNRNIHYPLYKRIHEKIKTPTKDERVDIIFIPDNSETETNLEKIYYSLKCFDVSVIGDMKTHILEENEALRKIDYFENGYKYIVDRITNAKIVICPLSHWTLLCKLQGTPVISWITNENSKYFSIQSSDNCLIINDNNINYIINALKHFIEAYQ